MPLLEKKTLLACTMVAGNNHTQANHAPSHSKNMHASRLSHPETANHRTPPEAEVMSYLIA